MIQIKLLALFSTNSGYPPYFLLFCGKCARFLTRFDKAHYNHSVWFGQVNKALGKKAEAKRSFEKALKICANDPNWPRESMKHIIA